MFNFFKRKARVELEDIVSAMAYANKTGDYYYHKPSEEVVLKVNPVFSGFSEWVPMSRQMTWRRI